MSKINGGAPTKISAKPMMITKPFRMGNSPRGMRSEISRSAPGRFSPTSPFPQAARILRSTTIIISSNAHAAATSHDSWPALCAVTASATARTARVASPSVSKRDQRSGATTELDTD